MKKSQLNFTDLPASMVTEIKNDARRFNRPMSALGQAIIKIWLALDDSERWEILEKFASKVMGRKTN